MRLFSNTRSRRARENLQVQKIDASILMRVESYMEKLEALKRPSLIRTKLIDFSGKREASHFAQQAPYYLLICAGRGEREYLNAGYAAGQAVSYLRFMGVPAAVLHVLYPWMQEEAGEGRSCVAAVAFGASAPEKPRRKKQNIRECSCISREYRENWPQKVLELAKRDGLIRNGCVTVLCRDDHISLGVKGVSGRRMAASELEAGIAAAGIMAAAEELWIDLTSVETGDPNCLISLCRREDRAEIANNSMHRPSRGRKAILKTVG